MSFIITTDIDKGKLKILADAKHINKTKIYDADFNDWIMNIHGSADKPFIYRARFINCTIIAEDLRAFFECFFDDSCKMLVKNMPVSGHESINKNRVAKPKPPQDKE